MSKWREFWILKTPGAEMIEYDEPMNMDWTCCKKTQVIEIGALLEAEERIANLTEVLGIIERNSCCEPCREAGLFARQALAELSKAQGEK